MPKNDFNRIVRPYELFTGDDQLPILVDLSSQKLVSIETITNDVVPEHIGSFFGRELRGTYHLVYSISAEAEQEKLQSKNPPSQNVSINDAQRYLNTLLALQEKLDVPKERFELLQSRIKKKTDPQFLATAFDATLTSLGYKIDPNKTPSLLNKLNTKECSLFLDTLLSNIVTKSNYHVLQLHFAHSSGARDKDDIVTLFLGRDNEYEKRLNEWKALTLDPFAIGNDPEKYMSFLLKTMFHKRGSLPIEGFESDSYKIKHTHQYYSPALNMFLEKVTGDVLVEYFNDEKIRIYDPTTTVSLSELRKRELSREEQIKQVLSDELQNNEFEDYDEEPSTNTTSVLDEGSSLYYKEYSASQLSRELPQFWSDLVVALNLKEAKPSSRQPNVDYTNNWIDLGIRGLEKAKEELNNAGLIQSGSELTEGVKNKLSEIAEKNSVSTTLLEAFFLGKDEPLDFIRDNKAKAMGKKIEECVAVLKNNNIDVVDFVFEELTADLQSLYVSTLKQYNISPEIMNLRLSFPDEFEKSLPDLNTMSNLSVLFGNSLFKDRALSPESRKIISYFISHGQPDFFENYIANGPDHELLSIAIQNTELLRTKILPPEKRFDNAAHLELTADFDALTWGKIIDKYSISSDNENLIKETAMFYVHELLQGVPEKLIQSMGGEKTQLVTSRITDDTRTAMVEYPLFVCHDGDYHGKANSSNRLVSLPDAVYYLTNGYSPNFGVARDADEKQGLFKPLENALSYYITANHPPFRIMQDEKLLSSLDYTLYDGKRHLHLIYAPVGDNDVVLITRDSDGVLQYYKNKREVKVPLTPDSVTKRIFTKEDIDYYCERIDGSFIKNLLPTRQNELASEMILKQYHADVKKITSTYTGEELDEKVKRLDLLYRDPDFSAILSERFSHYSINDSYIKLCDFVDKNYYDPVFMSNLVARGFNEIASHSKNIDVIKDVFTDYAMIADVTPISITNALTRENIKMLPPAHLKTLLSHKDFTYKNRGLKHKIATLHDEEFKAEIKNRDSRFFNLISDDIIAFYSSRAASMPSSDFKNRFSDLEELGNNASELNFSSPYSVLQGLVTLQDFKDNLFSPLKLRSLPITSLQTLHDVVLDYFDDLGKPAPNAISFFPTRSLYVEKATSKMLSVQGNFLDSSMLFPENKITPEMVKGINLKADRMLSDKVNKKLQLLGITDTNSLEFSYLYSSFYLYFLKNSKEPLIRESYSLLKDSLVQESFSYARPESSKTVSDAVKIYGERVGGRKTPDEARTEIEGNVSLPVFEYLENLKTKNDIFDSFIALEDKNVYFSSILGIYVLETPGFKGAPASFGIYEDFASSDGVRDPATKEKLLELINNDLDTKYNSNEFGKEIARRKANIAQDLINSGTPEAHKKTIQLSKKNNMNLLHYMPDSLERGFIHDSVYRVSTPLKTENKHYFVRVRFNTEIPFFTDEQIRGNFPKLHARLDSAVNSFYSKCGSESPHENSPEYKRKYVDLFSSLPEFSSEYNMLANQIKQQNDPRYEYALLDFNPYESEHSKNSIDFKSKDGFMKDFETFLKIHASEERVYFLNLPNMNSDNRISSISMVKENEELVAFETLVSDLGNYRNFKYNIPPKGHIIDPIHTLGWCEVTEQKQNKVVPTESIVVLKHAIDALNKTTSLLLYAAGQNQPIRQSLDTGFYQNEYLWHSVISDLFKNKLVFDGLCCSEIPAETLEKIKKLTTDLETLYNNSVDSYDSLTVMSDTFALLEKELVDNYKFLFTVTTPENEHFYCISGYEQKTEGLLGVPRFLVSPEPIDPTISLNEMGSRMTLGGTTTCFVANYGVARSFETEDDLIAQPGAPALFNGGDAFVKEFVIPVPKSIIKKEENKDAVAPTFSFD